jgi:hypothetical protein
MSATFAIVLAVLSLGSCFACYMLGRDSMKDPLSAEIERLRQEIKDYKERKRRWEEFDDED